MFLTHYEIFEDIKVIFRGNKPKKDSRFNDQKKTKDDQGSTNNCTVNLRLSSTQRCDLSRGRGYFERQFQQGHNIACYIVWLF